MHFAGTAATPPAPAVVWRTAPDHGDINPGTKHGQTLFMEITKGLPIDQRLELTRSNGPQIHIFLRARESNFRAVTNIPYNWFSDGNVAQTANLLQQHHHLRLYDVQRAGHALFDRDFNADDPIGPLVMAHTLLAPSTRRQIWGTGPGFTGR